MADNTSSGYARPRVSPLDGPVARINTPEWHAWHSYYKSQQRWFTLSEMERYARMKIDWPVTSTLPPPVMTKK